jgi:hypothetical protein
MDIEHLEHLPILHAGFPSPADDYIQPDLDFNALLKPRPNSTIPY